MAEKARKLAVQLHQKARRNLWEIWVWNENQYGSKRADSYIEFLRSRILKLESDYNLGRTVPTRLNYRYIVIKRRNQGFGHVAVYQITTDAVHILHIFHTAQNWEESLADPSRNED